MYGLGLNLTCLLNLFSSVGARFEFSVLVSVFVFIRMDPVPFPFFFCLSLSDFSALDSCCEVRGVGRFFSSCLSYVYSCGLGRSHMDG